jgi:hypothetical protein
MVFLLVPAKAGKVTPVNWMFEIRESAVGGSFIPILMWRHYADHQAAPLCRSWGGSFMPISEWLH